MSRIEVYRRWFEQEIDSNKKMLKMLRSVKSEQQSDPRYHQALVLAAHLAACRENWLERMQGGKSTGEWWPENVDLKGLPKRYADLEVKWSAYLAELTDDALDRDFDFPTSKDLGYRWNIEGQIRQLVGHSFYHRGQIALLVDQLGGKTEDTDYLYWEFKQHPDRWKRIDLNPGA